MNTFSFWGPTENARERRLSGHSWLIILIGTLLVSSLWIFVRYQISDDYDRTITEASMETMNLATAFEEQSRRIVADADKDLLNLKRAYEREGISSPVVTDYIEGRGGYTSRNQVAIYNEQGFLIGSFIKGLPVTNYSDRAYFQVHRNSIADTLFIGQPIKLKASGQNTIPLSRRINKPDGSFGGIVYIGLKTDYFLEYYQKINLGPDQLISLVGMDGFNRVRRSGDNYDSGQDNRGSQFWHNVQVGHSEASFLSTNILDGVTRINSYRVMPDYPLIVAVGRSTQVALVGYEQRKQGYIFGASLASLFILFFCAPLVSRHEKNRRLTAAVQQLNLDLENKVAERTIELQDINATLEEESTERQMAQGALRELNAELENEVAERTRELQEINATLEEEIMERQAAQQSLHESHDALVLSDSRYRGLFAHMRKAFVYFKIIVGESGRPADYEFVDVNSSFERMFGRKAVDILGKPLTYAFPESKDGVFKWVQKYSEEALKDQSIDFEQQVDILDKWYQISAYSPERNYISVLIADITENKVHEMQSKYYANEVAATNTELKSFVNTIAHDFRSPMVNLKGFSTELGYSLAELKQVVYESEAYLPREVQAKVDELLDKDVPDAQRFINSAVDRLSRMVDALLDLSRMGRLDMNYAEVDMSDLVNTVLLSYKHQIDKMHIQVEVGAFPKIQTVHLAIEQIIGNLLDNSIKYLDPSRLGKIEVTCIENENEYVVGLKDNGRGITTVDCEKIFDPFRRSGKTDQPGDGLGLAYVRTLVRQLGGRVWCESELGVGTKMIFTVAKRF